MEEKKLVYSVIVDCWSLFKDRINNNLSDAEWERLVNEANARSEHYRNNDVLVWNLFRDIYTALERYKQERDKHGSN